MTIWPPKPQDIHRPAYRSLADIIMRAVEAGELRPGDRLPTHRKLAFDLDLSVQTVSRAYDGLIRRGVITGEVGRGTFVRRQERAARTPYLAERQYGAIIDCSILKPVLESMHDDVMKAALGDLATDLPSRVVSSFRPAVSTQHFRDAALNWLALCGIEPDTQYVVPTNGNTSAMTIAMMTAVSPGGVMLTEDLSHHTLKPLCDYLGLTLRGVAMDDEGMVPEALEEACSQSIVSAIYLMPTGLNPRARTMGTDRRAALVAIARRYNLLILENDAWGPLQPHRPPPIASLAPERSFYFTGFTKCLMPGLRAGLLVVPDTYESAVSNRHLVTNWTATPLLTEIAARWIEDGTAVRLLNWQRQALGMRNAIAAEILGELPFGASPNGMHVWLPLSSSWDEEDFVAHARLHGVAVAPGSTFAITPGAESAGVRICLGSATESELEQGLRIISRLARSNPEPALLAF